MISGIYSIINIYSNKFYIGSAINLKSRWSYHRSVLNKKKHPNIHLQRAYNKHWISPFIFTVLEYCEPEKIIEREQFWIDELKPEYNILKIAGSPIGYKHSPDVINSMKGKIRSKEHCENLSKSLKGRIITPEHRTILSEINRHSHWRTNFNVIGSF